MSEKKKRNSSSSISPYVDQPSFGTPTFDIHYVSLYSKILRYFNIKISEIDALTKKDVMKAFRIASIKYHPDKNVGKNQVKYGDIFKIIIKGKKLLSSDGFLSSLKEYVRENGGLTKRSSRPKPQPQSQSRPRSKSKQQSRKTRERQQKRFKSNVVLDDYDASDIISEIAPNDIINLKPKEGKTIYANNIVRVDRIICDIETEDRVYTFSVIRKMYGDRQNYNDARRAKRLFDGKKKDNKKLKDAIMTYYNYENNKQILKIMTSDLKGTHKRYGSNSFFFEAMTGSLDKSDSRGGSLLKINIDVVFPKLLNTLMVFHKAGLGHRDLKPHNIGFSINKGNNMMNVKLIDIDLMVDENCNDTLYRGTYIYTSGSDYYNFLKNGHTMPLLERVKRQDVYALGIMIFNVLSDLDYINVVYEKENIFKAVFNGIQAGNGDSLMEMKRRESTFLGRLSEVLDCDSMLYKFFYDTMVVNDETHPKNDYKRKNMVQIFRKYKNMFNGDLPKIGKLPSHNDFVSRKRADQQAVLDRLNAREQIRRSVNTRYNFRNTRNKNTKHTDKNTTKNEKNNSYSYKDMSEEELSSSSEEKGGSRTRTTNKGFSVTDDMLLHKTAKFDLRRKLPDVDVFDSTMFHPKNLRKAKSAPVAKKTKTTRKTRKGRSK